MLSSQKKKLIVICLILNRGTYFEDSRIAYDKL